MAILCLIGFVRNSFLTCNELIVGVIGDACNERDDELECN